MGGAGSAPEKKGTEEEKAAPATKPEPEKTKKKPASSG
jgi:hypothetical protein